MATGELAFYKSLLDLAVETDLQPLLLRSLEQVMALTSARWGYLEIRAGRDGERIHSVGHGTDGPALDVVRQAMSRGVIGAALASGEAITTLDPELSSRASVRTKRVDLVLCAPVGRPVPFGVVYLQGRTEPGPFTARHQELVLVMSEQLGVLADRLLTRSRAVQDPTSRWRRLLEATDFIGSSQAAARLLAEACRVLRLPVSTALIGPAGSGKSHTALLLHASRDLPGDCVRLDASLADGDTLCAAWRQAQGGTLLLEQVTELPQPLQPRLTALLDEDGPQPWLLCTSRSPLEVAVTDGRLRGSLAARLARDRVLIPGLDQRSGDLHPLANHLAHRKAAEYGIPPRSLSPSALLLLESHPFPEHLHTLAAVVHRGLTRALEEDASQITPKHLFDDDGGEVRDFPSLQRAIQDFTMRYVRQHLERNDGNVSATARDLDVSASYLHRLRRRGGF